MATLHEINESGSAGAHVKSGLLNRVAWGAIFAGVATALITQLLINMLGVGVGAASLDIGAGADNSGTGFSIGAGLWWVVSGIIAAFVGGVTAGRLSGTAGNGTARWHGLVTWCVTMMVIVYLLSSAVGGLLGGAFNVIGSTVSGAGKAAASTASGVASVTNGDMVAKEARQLVDPNGAQSVQDSIGNYLKASYEGDPAAAQAAKTQAVAGLAQSAHITPAEATARIDSAEASAKQTYETAKAKATQAAEATRKGVATAAIVGFFVLLLSAAASWFGGGIGAAQHERTAVRLRQD